MDNRDEPEQQHVAENPQEVPPSSVSALAHQAVGVAHKALGTVLGDDERVTMGDRMVTEAHVDRHMSRAIAASERAAHAVAEALHEAGEAEMKMGQLNSDPGLLSSGHSKSLAAQQIMDRVSAVAAADESTTLPTNTTKLDAVEASVISLP